MVGPMVVYLVYKSAALKDKHWVGSWVDSSAVKSDLNEAENWVACSELHLAGWTV